MSLEQEILNYLDSQCADNIRGYGIPRAQFEQIAEELAQRLTKRSDVSDIKNPKIFCPKCGTEISPHGHLMLNCLVCGWDDY